MHRKGPKSFANGGGPGMEVDQLSGDSVRPPVNWWYF